jgi:hypothetical protein
MDGTDTRKCTILGCNNPLKGGATKYCSIKCCHVAQKKSRNRCARGCGDYAKQHLSRYCSIACAHCHRYRCEAETFLARGGVYGYVAPHFLARILKDYYGEQCLRCGWAKRHPKTGSVPIEVEHIDGNWQNSRLTNLSLLCPNCHALTPTFRALNRGRGRAYRLSGRADSNDPSVQRTRATRDLREVSRALSLQLELLPPT